MRGVSLITSLCLGLAVPVALIGAVAVPAAAQAAQPSAADIAGRVVARYAALATYRAAFEQTLTDKVKGTKKTSAGTLIFARPAKMSWSYTDPAGDRVVSDGTTVKVYDQAAGAMYETSPKSSPHAAALVFLMGQGKLTKDFRFTLLDAASWDFDGYVLAATPKAATPLYTKLLFLVDATTADVRGVILLGAQGTRNRFQLSAPVEGQPVGKDELKFTPPPGTKVVKP